MSGVNWELYEGFLPLAFVLLGPLAVSLSWMALTSECRQCNGRGRYPYDNGGRVMDRICWCFDGRQFRWWNR